MNAPAAKRCPFCGDADPSIDEVDVGVWVLVCEGCQCMGPVQRYESGQQPPERAIELWNRRGKA